MAIYLIFSGMDLRILWVRFVEDYFLTQSLPRAFSMGRGKRGKGFDTGLPPSGQFGYTRMPPLFTKATLSAEDNGIMKLGRQSHDISIMSMTLFRDKNVSQTSMLLSFCLFFASPGLAPKADPR